jgi:site-specific recombinase XerD
MVNEKKTMIGLIESKLQELETGQLSKIYSYIFDLEGNSSSGKSLRNISRKEIIEEFLNYYNTISSKTTKSSYKYVLNDLLKYIYPDITDAKILDYIRGREWKPNTLSRNLIVINRFLKFLYEKGYTATDLSNVMKAPKRVATAEFCPNNEQLNNFLSSIKAVFKKEGEIKLYKCIFRLYAKTGMRRNELLNLNVEDLHFDERRLIIRNTKNKDDRPIPIDLTLEKLLKDYLSYFGYKSGPLFRGKMGRRLIRQSLATAFTKLKEKSGMPKKFRLHSFRRYFANVLRKNGVDLGTIAQLLGHRDLKTTKGYFNIDNDEMMTAMEIVQI